MQLTADMLARAATFSDRKLTRLFEKWEKEYGIDPTPFGIERGNADSIRHALVQADRTVLKRLNALLAEKQ